MGTILTGAFCIRAFGGAPRVKRYRLLDHQVRRGSVFGKQDVQEVRALIIIDVTPLEGALSNWNIAWRLPFFR